MRELLNNVDTFARRAAASPSALQTLATAAVVITAIASVLAIVQSRQLFSDNSLAVVSSAAVLILAIAVAARLHRNDVTNRLVEDPYAGFNAEEETVIVLP